MSILHVVSSQTFDQIQNNGHISYLFIQSQATFDNSYLFVDWFDLVREYLVLLYEDVSLNLSPEFGFPVVVLQID